MSAPSFPFVRSTAVIAVSPSAVGESSHPLIKLSDALTSAGPGLTSAWAGAARALAGQHTGQILTACQPGVVAGLAACAGSMEGLGRALAGAAEAYRGAENQAVVPLQTGH